MKNFLLLAGLLIFVSAKSALAQNDVLPMYHDSVYSEILKETRGFDVVLPTKYSTDTKEVYDVIYVGDAEWSTRIVSNIYEFLSIDFMPQNIIIGIHNKPSGKDNMRGRDFTPSVQGDSNNSGGADKFRAFLKTELLPYINKKYRTSGLNTFCGSSLGGLFGMYVLLKDPGLFNSYLLADPALWWDNGLVLKLAAEKLETLPNMPRTLLIAGRDGEAFRGMGSFNMDSILRIHAPKGLHWKVNKYVGETHNAMLFRTEYDGLKFTYEGYSRENIEFHPMNGIVMAGQPITMLGMNDPLRVYRYTTDGSMPTMQSKIPAAPFVLDSAYTLTVTGFCDRPKYNKTVSGKFIASKPFPAIAKMKNAKPGGLHYNYYEGKWDSLPDFIKVKPISSGMATKDFNLSKLPKHEGYAVLEEGQFSVDTTGNFLFGVDCDGSARLTIDGKQLINYDGYHAGGNFQSFMLALAKGLHSIKIEYLAQKPSAYLNLIYIKPGSTDGDAIPFSSEYSK